MTAPSTGAIAPGQAWQAPILLLVTGTLLTVTIVLSRLAGDENVPMLWFVSASMGGGGAVLLGIAALSAVAVRVPPHATPPFVSMAHSRMAMASASLSSAGLKPRARAAATMVALSALP